MSLRTVVRLERAMCGALLFLGLFGAPMAQAQGPAPETAPPLFPGGGLISYNSIFTTRGEVPESPGAFPRQPVLPFHTKEISTSRGGSIPISI